MFFQTVCSITRSLTVRESLILQPHTTHTPAQVVEAAKEVAMETEAEVTVKGMW